MNALAERDMADEIGPVGPEKSRIREHALVAVR